MNTTEEPECGKMTSEEVNPTQPEGGCELKHPLRHDTDQIALLDMGSTFNSTNDRELMVNVIEAAHPITSRTNVGQ